MAKESAYCVKCKAKREIKNGTMKHTKNGRPMICGACPSCKTKICRFMPGATKKKGSKKSKNTQKKH